MKQEELIKSCADLLYKLCDLVAARNSLNYYDINISCEYFFIPLLNQLFECDLHNLNAEEKNATAIDLYDDNKRIAIQVTSDSSSKKIHNTLRKYRNRELYKRYDRIIIIAIVRSHKYKTDFSEDTSGHFSFSAQDIFTIKELIKHLSTLDIGSLESIQKYLQYQLDTLFDETQAISLSRCFEYICQNTNGILNESFFEIEDDIFIAEFKKALDSSDVIHFSSLSIEEGRYCILNLLHKTKPTQQVYVIKSKDAWENAAKHLSSCILIPAFQSEEIPAIKNNITVFIHSSDLKPNELRFPRRTIRFLSNRLRENGYEDPHNLLIRTHGLYYFIKKELFTGQIGYPNWVNDKNKAILIATLLGKWTECNGDKSIIEELYGKSYEEFISYLDKYMNVEDAFVIRKRGKYNEVVFELTDPLLSIHSRNPIVKPSSTIASFFELTKRIISNRDPVFDKPFEKHYYLFDTDKPNYSIYLKTGLIRTLILLALYHDYQAEVSNVVREYLSQINSINDWAYMSQFIEQLGEAAPAEVLDCLERHLDNHAGLLDLFTVEKPQFLFGTKYYTHILWCLEQFLTCKEYAIQTIKLFLALGEKIDTCPLSNSPREDLSKVFCTWCNVSTLSIEDKIELAKFGVEQYLYFWDILYDEVERITSVFSNSNFIYRYKEDEIAQYEAKDDYRLKCSYISILLSDTKRSIEKIVKLLEILPKCSEDLFQKISEVLLNTMEKLGDPEKEQIKTALRRIIYRNRFYSKQWGSSSERINRIEKICLGITFNDWAYDFLYLIEPNELPILNPIAFESNNDYFEKNEAAKENTIAAEINRMKDLDIKLPHFLSLKKTTSNGIIGRIIGKFYCEFKYDESILEIIIGSCEDPIEAITYVHFCSSSDCTVIHRAIEYLRKDHYADKYFVAFVTALPFDEKAFSLVQGLPDYAAANYWRDFRGCKTDDKKLLNAAIENLLLYSCWHKLFHIMYMQSKQFSVEKILSILSESIRKINEEKYQISNNDAYLIKELLSTVYDRIGIDFERYPELLEIEILLFRAIDWEDMKCCQYMFKRNANYYADILSACYKRDDGELNIELSSDQQRILLELELSLNFCPGEENGSINKDVLSVWISTFHKRLETQGQRYLFTPKLGKLFACSPNGSDGTFPHECIRQQIEEIGDNELIESFAVSLFNKRGVFNMTGGKEELILAQKYRQMKEQCEIRYPKTSKAFSLVSEHYMQLSKRERELAQDTDL